MYTIQYCHLIIFKLQEERYRDSVILRAPAEVAEPEEVQHGDE